MALLNLANVTAQPNYSWESLDIGWTTHYPHKLDYTKVVLADFHLFKTVFHITDIAFGHACSLPVLLLANIFIITRRMVFWAGGQNKG